MFRLTQLQRGMSDKFKWHDSTTSKQSECDGQFKQNKIWTFLDFGGNQIMFCSCSACTVVLEHVSLYTFVKSSSAHTHINKHTNIHTHTNIPPLIRFMRATNMPHQVQRTMFCWNSVFKTVTSLNPWWTASVIMWLCGQLAHRPRWNFVWKWNFLNRNQTHQNGSTNMVIFQQVFTYMYVWMTCLVYIFIWSICGQRTSISRRQTCI